MHVILRFYDHIEMYSRSEVECDRVCCVGQREEGVGSLYRLDGALNWAQFAARSAEIGSAGHVCPTSEILALILNKRCSPPVLEIPPSLSE